MNNEVDELEGLDLTPNQLIFLRSTDLIKIPKKTHKSIDFIPTIHLLEIHKDIKVAKELCLLFLSILTYTLFVKNKKVNSGKKLKTEILASYFRKPGTSINTKDTKTYQAIIKALKIGTPDKGPFIFVEEKYKPGEFCRTYHITDTYQTGFQEYTIKTKYVKGITYRNHCIMLAKLNNNSIAKNMLNFYGSIELPTKEYLLTRGKELIKQHYHTNSGKKLTLLGKHNYKKRNEVWKDADNRVFLEKHIEIFEYLTHNGFIIPIIGDEKCPRVYDSISLLPSWIRKEIKIDGKKLVDIDYKCLHPNLIMNIYGGSTKYITHEKVANDIGLDVKNVKIKHLSFFNLKESHMISSKLFKYYNTIETDVMNKILLDKKLYDYNCTSKFLFELEVQIMTKVIEELNKQNIYVGYIYDAIIVNPKDFIIAKNVMNKVVLEFGVYTNTKDCASDDIFNL